MSVNLLNNVDSDPCVDYRGMRALVVDDYPGMRSAFKNTLANFGMTKIDLASAAAEAIYRVKHSNYDIIVCDYNLGEGRDGQQLLEELRHRQLIGLETVFVMVTAESLYEKVVSTAELAPDDYLIKPFNADVLRNRLDVILQRKLAFSDIYRLFGKGDLEACMAACDELMRERPKYVVDALRFKGELLNAMGRFEEAEALYKKILEMRAVPWARLGLARALHLQDQQDEAEELLQEIIDERPEMVAAYDLLCDVRLSKKDSRGAQEALQMGTAISAKTVRRQQKLGEVAYRNGDLDTAKKALSTALEKGRHSIFVSAKDYADLCRIQLEQGDLAAAANTLKDGKTVLQETPEGQLAAAVMQGMLHTRAGRSDLAQTALDEADRLRKAGVRGDERLMLDLAEGCMQNGRHEACDEIIAEVARNAHDSEALLAKAKKLYADAGRAEAGNQVLSRATATVRALNNEGVMLAQKGQLSAAVGKLRQATREAPHNPRVAMNAAWVMLRLMEAEGLDHDLYYEVEQLLATAERLAPGHTRLPGLQSKLREVKRRFGIQRH